MNIEENIITCPHCNEFVIIQEINCGIFRHGILKSTHMQMDPHSNKETCIYLKSNDLIYGCGKPFQLIKKDNAIEIVICDYI
jgi:DNA-directed RNA polymerase subunit RPC12/RpoP